MCWNMSVIPTHDIAQQHGTGMKDTLKCVQCDAHIRACLHPQCFPRDCSGASVLACAWIRLLMLHAYMDVNARWCVSSFWGMQFLRAGNARKLHVHVYLWMWMWTL